MAGRAGRHNGRALLHDDDEPNRLGQAEVSDARAKPQFLEHNTTCATSRSCHTTTAALIQCSVALLCALPPPPAGMSLKGRKVAVFGCGDQHGYGDYFVDAMEELYSSFAAAGCDMVGRWPTKGYEHTDSKVCDSLSLCVLCLRIPWSRACQGLSCGTQQQWPNNCQSSGLSSPARQTAC